MNKVLYIGHYEFGSTSRMRGEYLKGLVSPDEFKIVDISIPMMQTNQLFRSIGWRFKKGPLITNINNYILTTINNQWKYDLVWVDKGVFIKPDIIRKLKSASGKLVHFTPDPAFTYHQSELFYKALEIYDVCITTKSYEIEFYQKRQVKKLLTATQGYHLDIHKPLHEYNVKKGVVFVGHHEENRERIIEALLQKNIDVTLAGINWKVYADKNKENKHLNYLGTGVFGSDYASLISGALIGLGLLSKIVPELHTTRTFEIPACGTALVTEYTKETSDIFTEDEAIFFTHENEVVDKVEYALSNPEWLKQLTEKGYTCVTNGGYDYKSIMKNLLDQIQEKVQ